MTQKMTVNNIFPTPVWAVDLTPDDTVIMNAELMRAIEGLMTPRPVLPPGVNWQTDPTIHRLPQFAGIVRLVEEAARSAVDFLKLQPRDLAVTGMWANVNPPGGRNQWHTHPNNFLASVYYIQTPEDEDRIVFEDPRPQAYVMMPRVTASNIYNGNNITFKVKAGRLVMFPAWLKHSVPANNSKRDRISIAFNLMFRNYFEESSPAQFEGTVKIDPESNH
jgi:uncharacterized protein (TIGR02466 family)